MAFPFDNAPEQQPQMSMIPPGQTQMPSGTPPMQAIQQPAPDNGTAALVKALRAQNEQQMAGQMAGKVTPVRNMSLTPEAVQAGLGRLKSMFGM